MKPTPELLLAHDRPGPRYTSYPTVPSWTTDVDDTVLATALAGVRTPVAVYVHVPFCREQCWFCGCNQVVSGRQSAGDRYLDALEKQLDALVLPTPVVDTARIHLGGGTPTWLDLRQLERLYDLLFARFRPIEGAELSVELDPDVTSDEQMDLLAERGVTRISVGVQSTDPVVLKAIHRPQETGRVQRCLEKARDHGMRGLNVDLIYGLPYQTRERFAQTLRDVLAVSPDRFAVYSYAHVPWLKRHQSQIDTDALPGPIDKMALFLQVEETLHEAGFESVGMDHFALPDDELAVASRQGTLHRNFMGYTTRSDLPLIGLGVSAISELDDVYAQQLPHLGAWYRAVEGGSRVVERGIRLSAEDRLRKDVIASLMCNFRVRKGEIAARHGVDFDAHFASALASLAPLVDEGLAELHPDRVEVTPLGRYLVRNVAMAFDDRLGDGRFSRTV